MGQATHDNLIPVPFASIERTRPWFELVTAEVFEIEGDGINIDVIGEARFIEDLPGDMIPFVVGG